MLGVGLAKTITQQLNHLDCKFIDQPVSSVYIGTRKGRSGETVDMLMLVNGHLYVKQNRFTKTSRKDT